MQIGSLSLLMTLQPQFFSGGRASCGFMLGKELPNSRNSAAREWTNKAICPHILGWHVSKRGDAGLHPRPCETPLPPCWGGRTWRTIPPSGEQGILFLGNAAPRDPEHSEGPKQIALKAPRGWNLIFSSTIGYKTQSSFLRHLDGYIIHLDNHS